MDKKYLIPIIIIISLVLLFVGYRVFAVEVNCEDKGVWSQEKPEEKCDGEWEKTGEKDMVCPEGYDENPNWLGFKEKYQCCVLNRFGFCRVINPSFSSKIEIYEWECVKKEEPAPKKEIRSGGSGQTDVYFSLCHISNGRMCYQRTDRNTPIVIELYFAMIELNTLKYRLSQMK